MKHLNAIFVIPSYTHGIVGRKYKNIREAIVDGFYSPYNELRIKRAFNFGNGTMEDLKRFAKNNYEKIIPAEKFYKIVDSLPDAEEHYAFVNKLLRP